MKPINILGYEKYHISEEGVVVNTETGKILRTDLNSSGYKRVTLSSGGVVIRITVHKLVALTFLKEIEGYVVNHKDGNKLNNHVTNLEWITPSENRKHAFRTKLCRRPNSFMSDALVHQICSAIQAGRPAKETRQALGIAKHLYDDIRSRRYYKDISDKYRW